VTEREAGAAEAEAQISKELSRVHEESYGVGAGRIVTHVLDDMVVVMMDVELTPAERTLIDAERGEAVRQTRESYQGAIEPTFRAVVERATGRRVDAFVSHMNVEPLFAVELFRLGEKSA
jgi:uncharacterized protein YbcI